MYEDIFLVNLAYLQINDLIISSNMAIIKKYIQEKIKIF